MGQRLSVAKKRSFSHERSEFVRAIGLEHTRRNVRANVQHSPLAYLEGVTIWLLLYLHVPLVRTHSPFVNLKLDYPRS